jgi:hypothetical protein
MGNTLNFIFGEGEINGTELFHQSGLYHYVINNPNFTKTTHYNLSHSNKNIFLLECRESLRDFYRKDSNNNAVLDILPTHIIQSIKNGNTKILLSSIAEATEITDNFFDNLKLELDRFGLSENDLILLDSNQNFLDVNTNFKIFEE